MTDVSGDQLPGAELAPVDQSGPLDGLGRDLLTVLRERAVSLVVAPLAIGIAAFFSTFLIPPTYVARTAILPPQGSQSAALAALANLSPLAGLAANSGGARTSGEQYVAMLQSVTVADRLIERFDLVRRYDARFQVDARRELSENTRVSLGRRDGVIVIEAGDTDPRVAADLANAYVDELRRLTSLLAVTEAQQRRTFFQAQLEQARDALTKAQRALQVGGFNPEAIKAEPKAAADAYARLKANAAAIEVRLQALRGSLAEDAPEVRQNAAMLSALRAQMAAAERGTGSSVDADYISRYREFKYQETLFELYARQFEIARVDESREGALIQVLDVATPPERKSKPKRATLAAIATLVGFAIVLAGLVVRHRATSGREPRAGA